VGSSKIKIKVYGGAASNYMIPRTISVLLDSPEFGCSSKQTDLTLREALPPP
jgi:hypothetical protein